MRPLRLPPRPAAASQQKLAPRWVTAAPTLPLLEQSKNRPRVERAKLTRVSNVGAFEELKMGRGLLLWLLGVPIPVIILLWLFFGH